MADIIAPQELTVRIRAPDAVWNPAIKGVETAKPLPSHTDENLEDLVDSLVNASYAATEVAPLLRRA